MSRLRLGVCLPQFTADGRAVLSAAAEAEADGYDVVSLFDHLTPLGGPPSRPILECLTTLTAVSAATERVDLLPLVLRASLRPAATLTAMLRTLALAAPGRVVCGLGGGDRFNAAEDHAVGCRCSGRRSGPRPSSRPSRRCATALPAYRCGSAGRVRRWRGWPARLLTAGTSGVRRPRCWPSGPRPWRRPRRMPAARPRSSAGAARSWSDRTTTRRNAGCASGVPAGRPGQLAGVVHGGPARVAQQLGVLAGAGASAFLLSFVGAGAGAARRLFAREAAPILRAGES
jgi:alkanesulfonate monooxygenase SsuD/methylene tetrahydromethanopterin reductase-like flavin-dependent oxidoreductase (luciferase family)